MYFPHSLHNHRPVRLPRILHLLEGENQDEKIKKLLKQRDPIYHKFADIEVVTGVKPFEELIKEIEGQLP